MRPVLVGMQQCHTSIEIRFKEEEDTVRVGKGEGMSRI